MKLGDSVNSNNRIAHIDGFRGLASLIVFWGHFLISFYPYFNAHGPNEVFFKNNCLMKYVAFSPISIFYNGHFAVISFLILSGYALCYKYFLIGEKNVVISSVFRRYFRLTIPIFFSCLLAYSCLKLGLFFNYETSLVTHSKWLAKFYSFTPDFIQMSKFALYDVYFNYPKIQTYNAPLWVMSIFLFGSFIVFSFLFLFGYIKKRYIIYLIALVLFHKTYYLAFVLGMILCDETTSRHNYHSLFKSKIILFFLFAMGIYFGSYKPHNFWMYRPLENSLITAYFKGFEAILYHIIGSFFIIYVLINSKIKKRIFSHRAMLFFGKISFSLYITHFIVICSLSCFLFNSMCEFMLPKIICFISTLAVTFLITIVISYLMYQLVERKAIQFSKASYNLVESSCRMVVNRLK